MFKNFILITFRNLKRHKVYVLINVIGLGLALALCIVAYYNQQFAADFDRNHENIEEIYKINITKTVNDDKIPYGITPISLGDAMQNDELSHDYLSRFQSSYDPIKYEDNVFNAQIGYGDDDYFKMFTFPLINGETADISDLTKIYLTEATAIKFFGEKNPVGEIVTLKNDSDVNFEFTVGGVLRDLPLNTSMRFEAFTNMKNYLKIAEIEDPNDWKRFTAATFVTIKDKTQLENYTAQLKRYLIPQNKAREDFIISSFYLEPLTTVGFNGRDMYAYWMWEAMHPAAIIAPSIMALLVLLIACFNFTNTSISFSNQRLKEIGVRKVLGGRKVQLIAQFLGENMILCLLALLVGLLFANYLVPGYSAMWPYLELEMNLTEDLPFYGFLVGLLVFTGLMAGLYPAFYVSGFQPIKILNNSLKIRGTGLLSKILLTSQFSISILALVCGVVFTQNAKFQNEMDLGYEKENIINIPTNNRAQYVSFKNEIANHTKINSLAGTGSHIGWSNYSRTVKSEANMELDANVLNIGANYINTMNMHLVEGRDFDINKEETDHNETVIVNQLLAERMQWNEALGQKLIVSDSLSFRVVGVVENFYLNDFYGPIEPTMFRFNKEEDNRLLVAQVNNEDLAEVNKYFEAKWKELNPYSPYRGFFQYEVIEDAKTVNNNIVYIFLFLSVLAIIMSGIGLYTLVSMQIMSRTKEMGIRKVLGASIAHLMGIINRQFIIILLIASLFGAVLGYYITDMLMSSIYVVYIDMNLTSFMTPILFTLLFAAITIGGKVFKATNRNPVESLRYE